MQEGFPTSILLKLYYKMIIEINEDSMLTIKYK
jgi:hypothetical protein